MENSSFQDLILESTPIIGVLTRVINSDLTIVKRVEYFALNLEGLMGLSEPEADTFKDSLLKVVQAKAISLLSLYENLEEHDEEGKPIEIFAMWNNLFDSVLSAYPERDLFVIGEMEEEDLIFPRNYKSSTLEE